ncbi:hypothetical protein [Aquiflexum sp.]
MKSKIPFFLLIALGILYNIWYFSQNDKEQKPEEPPIELPITIN